MMMEETLKYFSLCSERMVQMKKTYNDVDAVTKLLDEKEKDLELAAKIGQTLLLQNKSLEDKLNTSDERLTVITDQNTQLRHEMKLKEQLLQIYTNDITYNDSEDELQEERKSYHFQFIDVDTLQKKVRSLEEQNLELRMESTNLKSYAETIEEKEKELMQDCVYELAEERTRNAVLMDELSQKIDECYKQQDEVTRLLAQIVTLQQKNKKFTIENEELTHHLAAAKDAQNELTIELSELREKYDECHHMLLEAQEEAKEIHRRSLPQGAVPNFGVMNPYFPIPSDSLAAELVNTVEQQLGQDPRLMGRGKKEYNESVMKTVKAVKSRAGSGTGLDFGTPPMNQSTRSSPSSSVISLAGSEVSENYMGDNESVTGVTPVRYKNRSEVGEASIPGSNDLETAIKRLSLRRQNKDAERKYAAYERRKTTVIESESDGEGMLTPRCHTPDSAISGDSFSAISSFSGVGLGFRRPEKLQIVKPMEGSLTLYQWQRLATPHMASMLDQRPGVVVKGFREIKQEKVMFALDDVEDDGQVVSNSTIPSKCYTFSEPTYTYTTSNINLLDNTTVTPSTIGTTPSISFSMPKRSSFIGSRASSTFSQSLGLASVLQERGARIEHRNSDPKIDQLEINPPNIKSHSLSSKIKPPSTPKKETGLNFLAENPNPSPIHIPGKPGPRVHRVKSGIYSKRASSSTSKVGTTSTFTTTTAHQSAGIGFMSKLRSFGGFGGRMHTSTGTTMSTFSQRSSVMMTTSVQSSPQKSKPPEAGNPDSECDNLPGMQPGLSLLTNNTKSGIFRRSGTIL
ncbi:trafficking kinesin-binding protein 1-like isoform X2 [Anneissia japonica]|uniref:trafficking kinesin-binding protein 1-like isoform X2 n=1 Tax=Anneissia japonica TaxID=1529436 RepID=UPI00142555AF|nr:trafficking kinesin-binding protein 1-like isoform X2 [Anneissia japonica]